MILLSRDYLPSEMYIIWYPDHVSSVYWIGFTLKNSQHIFEELFFCE